MPRKDGISGKPRLILAKPKASANDTNVVLGSTNTKHFGELRPMLVNSIGKDKPLAASRSAPRANRHKAFGSAP